MDVVRDIILVFATMVGLVVVVGMPAALAMLWIAIKITEKFESWREERWPAIRRFIFSY